MAKVSFREQVLRAREDAIVSSVNRLLAQKGFDLMTVDEVAADVGIAKASLYKHFTSKEELAAAAMVRVLERALEFLATLPADPEITPLAQLKAVARWTMEVQLAGEMPSLPSQNSSLRATLMTDKVYLDRLMEVSDRLGAWITGGAAQRRDRRFAAAGGGALHAVCARLRPGARAAQAVGPVQRRAHRRDARLYLLRWPGAPLSERAAVRSGNAPRRRRRRRGSDPSHGRPCPPRRGRSRCRRRTDRRR